MLQEIRVSEMRITIIISFIITGEKRMLRNGNRPITRSASEAWRIINPNNDYPRAELIAP
jgi:hypothetical protein